jgi:hypothetical protein
MYNLCRYFYFFIILISLSIFKSAYGTESLNQHQTTMSVAKINAVNCDASFGAIIEDLLSAELHSTGLFTLKDKKQMERIEWKEKLEENNSKNNQRIADHGKANNIDKMIVGSVTKHTGFILSVMSIDTQSANVDIVVTENITNNSDLNKIIRNIAEKIKTFYIIRQEINKKFEITAKAASFIPIGVYSEYLHPSYGGLASLSVNDIAGKNSSLFLCTGINNFSVKSERYKYFTQLYFIGGPSGRFSPLNSMIISPKAGVGAVWTMMKYDIDGKRNSEGFHYEKRIFQNYCFLFETEFALHIRERMMFSFSDGFMYIFDESKNGYLFFISAGIKTLF